MNAKARTLGLVAALVLALGGCASMAADETGRYASPIGTAPVISNETPYSQPLSCLGRHARTHLSQRPRVAVGNIVDFTGREEFETGRPVTQGAALMAMSALSKSGAALVERFDTAIGELELQFANNKLIGGHPDESGETAHRRILTGSIPGSDYYLVGGITELNYNIRSYGFDGLAGEQKVSGAKVNLGGRMFVMNVGLDLRLVRTTTLEVVDVISYQKQIQGREISAGIFDVLGTNILDAGLGERSLEPVQLAVRAVVERAVLEMMARLYAVGPGVCQAQGDPLADPRADPYRWLAPTAAPVEVAQAPPAAQPIPVASSISVASARPAATAPVREAPARSEPVREAPAPERSAPVSLREAQPVAPSAPTAASGDATPGIVIWGAAR